MIFLVLCFLAGSLPFNLVNILGLVSGNSAVLQLPEAESMGSTLAALYSLGNIIAFSLAIVTTKSKDEIHEICSNILMTLGILSIATSILLMLHWDFNFRNHSVVLLFGGAVSGICGCVGYVALMGWSPVLSKAQISALSAGMAGGAVFPPLVAFASDFTDFAFCPTECFILCTGMAVVCFLAFVLLNRRTRVIARPITDETALLPDVEPPAPSTASSVANGIITSILIFFLIPGFLVYSIAVTSPSTTVAQRRCHCAYLLYEVTDTIGRATSAWWKLGSPTFYNAVMAVLLLIFVVLPFYTELWTFAPYLVSLLGLCNGLVITRVFFFEGVQLTEKQKSEASKRVAVGSQLGNLIGCFSARLVVHVDPLRLR